MVWLANETNQISGTLKRLVDIACVVAILMMMILLMLIHRQTKLGNVSLMMMMMIKFDAHEYRLTAWQQATGLELETFSPINNKLNGTQMTKMVMMMIKSLYDSHNASLIHQSKSQPHLHKIKIEHAAHNQLG